MNLYDFFLFVVVVVFALFQARGKDRKSVEKDRAFVRENDNHIPLCNVGKLAGLIERRNHSQRVKTMKTLEVYIFEEIPGPRQSEMIRMERLLL